VIRPFDAENRDLHGPVFGASPGRVRLESRARSAERAAAGRVPQRDADSGDLARGLDDVVKIIGRHGGQAHRLGEGLAAVGERPRARGDEAAGVLEAQRLGCDQGGGYTHRVADGAPELEPGTGRLVGEPVRDVGGVDRALGVEGER